MKKMIASKATVAAIALAASASAQAFVGPGGFGGGDGRRGSNVEPAAVCLDTTPSEHQEGTVRLGDCNKAEANKVWDAELKADGCAEGQVAVQVTGVTVESCPVPVQL